MNVLKQNASEVVLLSVPYGISSLTTEDKVNYKAGHPIARLLTYSKYKNVY